MPDLTISDTRRNFGGSPNHNPNDSAGLHLAADLVKLDTERQRIKDAERDALVARFALQGDRVLLQDERLPEAKSSSGIILPDARQTRGRMMRVYAVGPDWTAPIAVGETVLVSTYAGTVFDVGEYSFLVARQEDVILRLATWALGVDLAAQPETPAAAPAVK